MGTLTSRGTPASVRSTVARDGASSASQPDNRSTPAHRLHTSSRWRDNQRFPAIRSGFARSPLPPWTSGARCTGACACAGASSFAASGCCPSAPAPVEMAIGTKPRLATSAVMSTGRRRVSPPSRIARSSGCPCVRSALMDDTNTTPFTTATPNNAMNPAPATMLKGMPRSSRAKTPPTVASGMPLKTRPRRAMGAGDTTSPDVHPDDAQLECTMRSLGDCPHPRTRRRTVASRVDAGGRDDRDVVRRAHREDSAGGDARASKWLDRRGRLPSAATHTQRTPCHRGPSGPGRVRGAPTR